MKPMTDDTKRALEKITPMYTVTHWMPLPEPVKEGTPNDRP